LLSPTPLSSMQFPWLDEPPVFFFLLLFFIGLVKSMAFGVVESLMLKTFYFAASASLQAVGHISIVCLSSLFNLVTSSSWSSWNCNKHSFERTHDFKTKTNQVYLSWKDLQNC
jgi:TRAP-type C4-dicarboxylate transport system permease small subunit